MYRILELLAFAAPFAAIAVWVATKSRGGPSVTLLLGAGFALALMLGTLFWLSAQDRLPGEGAYIPPRLETDGIRPAERAPR